jgi:MFS family permease
MGYGLLSIFLPLYVTDPHAIGGSLVDFGLMASVALFLAIPASFLWGYMCDRTRRYKRYILLSFSASAVLLYLFTYTHAILLLIVLYGVMSMLHVAHEAPKNVLIAELYSRPDWEKHFAFYEGFTEAGWLIGLLLGFFLSTYGLGPTTTLFVCSGLNLVAFILSLVFLRDPALVFERSLVSLEKTVDFASRGVFLASRLFDGASLAEKLRKENIRAFCGGLILFSLATSILFTPMPIFVSNVVAAASLPAGMVFVIFVLNSGGGIAGYALARSRSEQPAGRTSLNRIVLLRSLFTFLFIMALRLSTLSSVGLATVLLILMGFVYAIFLVFTLSLSMEMIPAGRSGLFNVLIGIGAACGSFSGPFIAETFGFLAVFISAGAIFLLAYVAFRIF